MSILHLCKPTVIHLLARELGAGPGSEARESPGGVWSPVETLPTDLCFATLSLSEPTELTAPSVNGLVAALADYVRCNWLGGAGPGPAPVVVAAAPGVEGLPGRAAVLERAWADLVRKRRAPFVVAGDRPAWPALTPVAGLYVYLLGFDRLIVAARFWDWGQRRMKDDPAAPSRSYLKIEEAYGILGRAPAPGETVADLGAAPGGWSYSAAKRGARVVAVDNGPLKGGAAQHPAIEHRRADAFHFAPAPGPAFDWLFVDLIENPYEVLDLLARWLAAGWCRHFIVNLKFGHHDPLALLDRVRAADGAIAPRCALLRARHLLHDREEITVVGRRP